MILTVVGAISVPIILVVCFKNIKNSMYLVYFLSAFTATAMLQFVNSNKTIQVYQFVGLLFIILMFMIGKKRSGTKYSILLLLFVLVSLVSLLYPKWFSQGTIVKTPLSDDYMQMYFSYQNVTQYLYLLFGYMMYLCTIKYFDIFGMNEKKLINLFRITLMVIIFLGVLQFLTSVNFFNSIFRNDFHHNDQFVGNRVRISSVTMEPSVLSLFIAPTFIGLLINFMKEFNKIDLIILLATLLVSIQNNSSSFWIALLVFCSFKIFTGIFKFRMTYKRLIFIIVAILMIFLFIILFRDKINFIFSTLIDKATGNNDSGSVRKYDFFYHLGIFRKFFITGVGYGSVRTKDLFTTYLCDVGLLGFLPFIGYIVNVLYKLIKIKDTFGQTMFGIVFSTVLVLMISVPEPYYLYIWIYFGISDYLIQKRVKSGEVCV